VAGLYQLRNGAHHNASKESVNETTNSKGVRTKTELELESEKKQKAIKQCTCYCYFFRQVNIL